MKRRKVNKGEILIRFKEYYTKTIFIYSGVLWVYLIDSESKIPFQYLSEGSSANFLNKYCSQWIFQIEADSDAVIMEVEQLDFQEIMNKDEHIKEKFDEANAKYALKGIKYNYFYYNQETRKASAVLASRKQRGGFILSRAISIPSADPFNPSFSGDNL